MISRQFTIHPKGREILASRIEKALEMIVSYGGIDGGHHKQWTLDQVVHILLEDQYDVFIDHYEYGGYEWDKGIAP